MENTPVHIYIRVFSLATTKNIHFPEVLCQKKNGKLAAISCCCIVFPYAEHQCCLLPTILHLRLVL